MKAIVRSLLMPARRASAWSRFAPKLGLHLPEDGQQRGQRPAQVVNACAFGLLPD